MSTPTSSRGVPSAVWAVVGLLAALLVLQAMVFPTYRAPDEGQHIDLVLALRGGAAYPDHGTTFVSRRVHESYDLVSHARGDPDRAFPLTADNAPPRGERPAFTEIAPDEPSDQAQNAPQHPPAYYLLMAAALAGVEWVVPGELAFDQTVLVLRLLTGVLVLPLPVLVFLTTRRLGLPERTGVAAALLPLAIPMLTHIGSAVNNDNLLVLAAMAMAPLVATVTRGQGRWSDAAALGVLTAVAWLTKGFGLVLPAWVVLAYALGAVRGRQPLHTLAHAATALGLPVLLAGWWWVRNLAVYGTLQPSHVGFVPAPDTFTPDVGEWIGIFAGRIAERFWVEPNILPEAASPLPVVATVVLLVLLITGVGWPRSRPAQRSWPFDVRLDLVVLVVPLGLLLAAVAYGAWGYYSETGIPFGIHGRYLYAGVVGLSVGAAAGLDVVLRSGRRWAPHLVLACVVITQALAGVAALHTYWGPEDAGWLDAAAGFAAWSPITPAVPALALLGAAAAVAWIMWQMTSASGQQRGDH